MTILAQDIVFMFNSLPPQIVFQEVPDHVSLSFTITGCPLRCRGCHSTDTWNKNNGKPLDSDAFFKYLHKYHVYINCVLFFGGEWHSKALIEKLKIAKQFDLKTCLYSGLEQVPEQILQFLDFVKVGPWLKERGGLANKHTNQRFYDVKTGHCLNFKFLRQNQQ